MDLRVGDISAISSKIKSYIYQDLYQKPSEVLLYRRVEDGGLGLHHLQSKALANLISTFLQTACSKRFQQSLYHSWLYKYHVEGLTDLPNPGFPPYYGKVFFSIIKEVKDNTPLNPVHLSVKEWYRLLLERNMTMRKVDQEGRMELIPSKVEEREPQVFWSESYRISRLKGLSPETKSFLFKMLHTLLPSKERIHHLTPTSSPLCWCNTGEQETYLHLFYHCPKNNLAADALLTCVQAYDKDLAAEKTLRLEIITDEPFLIATVAILSTGLQFIWENRRLKKSTTVYSIRAELEAAVSLRRKSSSKVIREAGNVMNNMISNFWI